MTEKDLEASDIESKVHDLAEAMNRVRSNQADRDDVVVDMKHAKLSRLELLAEELATVRDDIPENVEQFEFAVTNGETPRLWIDMTSFVRMAADGREYEFVKDTRLGRTILGRTTNRKHIGQTITDYVAERLLERERMIEGDWIAAKAIVSEAPLEDAVEGKPEEHSENQEATAPVAETQNKKNPLVWFLIGIGLAAIFYLGLAEAGKLDDLVNWFRGIAN